MTRPTSSSGRAPTGEDEGLRDLRVAFTGKLASMSREEAAWKSRAAGAILVEPVGLETDLLVVGQGGPPLGADGRLTSKLEQARALNEAGGGPRIVSEQDWLTRLRAGDAHSQADLRRLYTREQLCRILGVTSGELRSWLRAGLIRPAQELHRLALFDFAEVSSARAIVELRRRGVSPGRIRQSIEQLAGWMPHARAALSQLEVIEGGRLTLRLEGEGVAETNGQLLLDFRQAELAPQARVAQPRPVRADPEQAFQSGLEAEEAGEFERAIAAYGEALRLGGPSAEICFNLGNVLCAAGRREEAVSHYLRATGADPMYVEAWNNLGNALSSDGRGREAIRAYRRALEIAPTYADAHFNLAETFAALGDLGSAREHWRAYLTQDPSSSWASEVRERLSECEGPSDQP